MSRVDKNKLGYWIVDGVLEIGPFTSYDVALDGICGYCGGTCPIYDQGCDGYEGDIDVLYEKKKKLEWTKDTKSIKI